MQINKLTKKGFTLMELLVTVILVAILASYGVYYYTDILHEGRYKAAKGQLAALGGATARFLLEDSRSSSRECVHYIDNVNTLYIKGVCNKNDISGEDDLMYDVFRCGYADKSLAIIEDYKLSFGCPNRHSCGNYDYMTVFMKPVAGQDDIVAACAYFDPDTDRVVEVRN